MRSGILLPRARYPDTLVNSPVISMMKLVRLSNTRAPIDTMEETSDYHHGATADSAAPSPRIPLYTHRRLGSGKFEPTLGLA